VDWLESFQRFVDRGSLGGALVGLGLALLCTPGLILVHELGHALAVKARGLPLRQLKVGDQTDVILTVGSFRMEFGRLLGEGDVGGYVLYDGRRSTPRDALVIALAGPAANLACAVVTGWLTMRYAGTTPNIPLTLAMLTAGGVYVAVANLRPTGVAADPLTWSDGLWARVAWRGRHHAGPMWRDPNEETTVAPPSG
jgi:membrane-associated protease RseP (regulator of RpoE activity)